MLVDLPFLPVQDPVVALITPHMGGGNAYNSLGMPTQPKHVAMGVYEIKHWNFGDTLEVNRRLVTKYPFDPMFSEGFNDLPEEERTQKIVEYFDDETIPHESGVCDDWHQIVQKWPRLVSDTRKFVISLVRIRKDEQPPSGGWRWHKWGTYIGTQEPVMEYIYDEPKVEEVFTFSIYEVK